MPSSDYYLYIVTDLQMSVWYFIAWKKVKYFAESLILDLHNSEFISLAEMGISP